MDTLHQDSDDPTIWVTYKDTDDLTEMNQNIQDIIQNIKLRTISRSVYFRYFPPSEHIRAVYLMFDIQIFVIDGKWKKVQVLYMS